MPESCSLTDQPMPKSAMPCQPSAWLTVKPMPNSSVPPKAARVLTLSPACIQRTANQKETEESTNKPLLIQNGVVGVTCTQYWPMLETM